MLYDNRKALPDNHSFTITDRNTGNVCSVTIEREISRGGTCVVYRGLQNDYVGKEFITRSVILKEFYPKSLDAIIFRSDSMDLEIPKEVREQFDNKLNMFCTGQAKHVAFADDYSDITLPSAFFSGCAHNTFYAVSKQVSGSTLSNEGISLIDALERAVSICYAISRVHNGKERKANGRLVPQCSLYLDLKPDNIFLFGNRALLFDFDTVQPYRGLSFCSYSDGWSAPEQKIESEKGYCGRTLIGYHTDIFAIGATVFYMLVGRCPSETDLEAIQTDFDWKRNLVLPSDSDVLNDQTFISELGRVMKSMLQPNAERREESYGDLKAATKAMHEFEHLLDLVENAPYRKGFTDTKTAIDSAKEEILKLLQEIKLSQEEINLPEQYKKNPEHEILPQSVSLFDLVKDRILERLKIDLDYETPIFVHELLTNIEQYFNDRIAALDKTESAWRKRENYLNALSTDALFDELRNLYPDYENSDLYKQLKKDVLQDQEISLHEWLCCLILLMDDEKKKYSHETTIKLDHMIQSFYTHLETNRETIVLDVKTDLASSSWKGRERNGFGIRHLISGSRYEGNWENDKYEGHGVFYSSNGDVYDGNWHDGKKDGQGTIVYKEPDSNDAIEYVGQWKNGLKHGRGKEKYASGKEYDGDWENGVPTGTGEYHYANGDVYSGNVVKGIREGYGCYSEAKRSYTGEWKNGQPEGIGNTVFEKGVKFYYGNYKTAKPEGFGIEVNLNKGRIYIGNWHEGKPTGKGVLIYLEGGTATINDSFDGKIVTEE